MELECIIYNVNIVTEKETLWGYIGIKDEKIVMIENGNPTVKAKRMINAEGKYIFPGAIDTHPHFLIRVPSGERIINMEQGRLRVGGTLRF